MYELGHLNALCDRFAQSSDSASKMNDARALPGGRLARRSRPYETEGEGFEPSRQD
jgi:hypothetical protein